MTGESAHFASIVIPLLNEEESLGELYRLLTEMLERSVARHELIFVDDGSTDGSLGILRGLRRSDRRVKIVSFGRNYGKSAALAEGFKAARGDVVVTLDADLQDDPAEIPAMVAMLDDGWDLVSGWKENRKDPISKTLPSRVWNAMVALVSGIRLHDFNCGLKAYRAEVVKRIRVYGDLHRFIPVLAGWEGFRVTEKAVSHSARRFGRSKYGASRFLNGIFDMMTVWFITRRSSSPLHFFGRVAALFLGAGGLITLYFFIVWLAGRGLRVRPLMVGGLVMIVIAVQIASFGLLAELFTWRMEKTFAIREYEVDD